MRTGLIWSFSFLGAALPEGSFNSSARWSDEKTFTCDLSQLGFSSEALDALQVITERLKFSEEYDERGGIDIGRFLMLTLYSTPHYYRITGMNYSLQEMKEKYFSGNTFEFAVTNSGVAFNDRLIQMDDAASALKVFFAASEGSGNLSDSTFTALEHEVFDVMPNGQMRFALFDANGKRKLSGDSTLGIAGKPGKCMWCHESSVLPLYTTNSDLPGYLTSQQFDDRVTNSGNLISAYRAALNSEVNYLNKQDHTKSELLYIGFMEPSAFRIAHEWGIPVSQVDAKLSGLSTHIYPEFPFLGNLYHRKEVDALAPYSAERVPESAREPSEYEPDFFN